jgi:eukaryotic translation initiation factor 2-alpha kinase 4
LALGEKVNSYHPPIPTSLPPDFRNFVSICINENGGGQLEKFDCKTLKTHPFLYTATTNPDDNDGDNGGGRGTAAGDNENGPRRRRLRTVSTHYDEEKDNYDSYLKSFTDYSNHSRLNTEFEVIGIVGEGAFGQVLKVKNKLDDLYYAIKRISIQSDNNSYMNKQITREIQLLSRLNHENVVRYYSTWVEKYFDDNKKDRVSEGSQANLTNDDDDEGEHFN